ncbi:hypothetical protein MKC54_20290 [[Clostridium] innocuum]|nr:hypothetical protein [[Clostridium] innocuum]MCR0579241.1 hypothetical protein [[Clostridium] innocuum]
MRRLKMTHSLRREHREISEKEIERKTLTRVKNMKVIKNFILVSSENYYKIAKLEINVIEGSYYFFLPTNVKGKYKKTSIHTSGRINYEGVKSKQTIFIEPISNITRENYIFGIYIPNFNKLETVLNISAEDIVIQNELFEHMILSFVISPIELFFENVLNLKILDNAYLRISFDSCNITNDDILFFTPHNSPFQSQCIDKYEAEKNYRNKLFKTNQMIILPPNEQGFILVHFSNVMARTPFLHVEFENSNQYIDIKTLSGNKTKIMFKIKDRKKGNQYVIDSNDIVIKSAALDAEIYDSGFIPEGYIKVSS